MKTYPHDIYHDCDITHVILGSVLAHISQRSCFHGQGGSSHPCGRGQTTWTLTEKIGKFTIILSRPFHFTILLLFVKEFAFLWLSRWIWSIDCKSSFFIELDLKGNCLIWDYFWIAYLLPNLEKPFGCFFWSLCRVQFDVHFNFQSLVAVFSSQLTYGFGQLAFSMLLALNIATNFCLSNSYCWVSIHIAHFSANLYWLSIYFCRSNIAYGSFSSNLVQNSTIFISLVATFVLFAISV